MEGCIRQGVEVREAEQNRCLLPLPSSLRATERGAPASDLRRPLGGCSGSRVADEAFSAFDHDVLIIPEWYELAVNDLFEFVGRGDSGQLLQFRNGLVATMNGEVLVVDGDGDFRPGLGQIFLQGFSGHWSSLRVGSAHS